MDQVLSFQQILQYVPSKKGKKIQKRLNLSAAELKTGRSEGQTDHVAKENHVISWSGSKTLDRESHQETKTLEEINVHMERTQLHEQRW